MTWQKQLQNSPVKLQHIVDRLDLSPQRMAESKNATKVFRFLAPESFISRIKSKDPADPLLKQILPTFEEANISDEFTGDPVGDLAAQVSPGLLHKYHGRVLLIVTGACPIHCRYCFRRHYPYPENSITQTQLHKALAYITANEEITEVILSGGDPLILSDAKLFDLIKQLETIPHLKRLRIHTRTPIVLPDRILESDLKWLAQSSLKTIIVLHCNHPNELDEHVRKAINKLDKYNILILNQSVLLRGVNDHADILAELSEKLFELNIQPYYLHLLDPVKGAMHFDVPIDKAKSIINDVRNKLPGYLVPKLVQERAGELSKTAL